MNLKIKYLSLCVLFTSIYSCSKQHIEADILIRNGTVYNGIDTAPVSVSVAIKDDKIVFAGSENDVNIEAGKIIDASDLIVAPGFIDPHTHADRDLNNPEISHVQPFLFQGVTTVVTGNDGSSFYPLSEYKALYESHGIGTNVVPLVGHGTIRRQIMGNSDRKSTDAELAQMQALLATEMQEGAFGMSTGLFYAPGSYSDTDEVIALAKIVSEYGGIYDTHLRDESSYTVGLHAAVDEAIEIGRQAGLPIHISHIKCLGTDVWHESDSIIKMIEAARAEGLDITGNQYPYEASATGLKAAVVPRWAESGGMDSLLLCYNDPTLKSKILSETALNIKRRGGPESLLIVDSADSTFNGKTLKEVALSSELSPAETVFKILGQGNVRVASFNMHPDDIANFMRQPWIVTGSDGNTGHPRKYGSFPRKYSRYILRDSLMSIGDFINGSTSKTADIFKIPKRGRIQKGHYADIILFDPDNFRDKADYNDAFQLSEGLKYSIINGQIVIDNGRFNHTLSGKVLSK